MGERERDKYLGEWQWKKHNKMYHKHVTKSFGDSLLHNSTQVICPMNAFTQVILEK